MNLGKGALADTQRPGNMADRHADGMDPGTYAVAARRAHYPVIRDHLIEEIEIVAAGRAKPHYVPVLRENYLVARGEAHHDQGLAMLVEHWLAVSFNSEGASEISE